MRDLRCEAPVDSEWSHISEANSLSKCIYDLKEDFHFDNMVVSLSFLSMQAYSLLLHCIELFMSIQAHSSIIP